jgi:hypothetical protein
MSEPFDFASSFGQTEGILWGEVFGDYRDPVAEALYHEAYFNKGSWESDELSAIRDSLNAYMMDEYGIDFDAAFDWNTWREMYESV